MNRTHCHIETLSSRSLCVRGHVRLNLRHTPRHSRAEPVRPKWTHVSLNKQMYLFTPLQQGEMPIVCSEEKIRFVLGQDTFNVFNVVHIEVVKCRWRIGHVLRSHIITK